MLGFAAAPMLPADFWCKSTSVMGALMPFLSRVPCQCQRQIRSDRKRFVGTKANRGADSTELARAREKGPRLAVELKDRRMPGLESARATAPVLHTPNIVLALFA